MFLASEEFHDVCGGQRALVHSNAAKHLGRGGRETRSKFAANMCSAKNKMQDIRLAVRLYPRVSENDAVLQLSENVSSCSIIDD